MSAPPSPTPLSALFLRLPLFHIEGLLLLLLLLLFPGGGRMLQHNHCTKFASPSPGEGGKRVASLKWSGGCVLLGNGGEASPLVCFLFSFLFYSRRGRRETCRMRRSADETDAAAATVCLVVVLPPPALAGCTIRLISSSGKRMEAKRK